MSEMVDDTAVITDPEEKSRSRIPRPDRANTSAAIRKGLIVLTWAVALAFVYGNIAGFGYYNITIAQRAVSSATDPESMLRLVTSTTAYAVKFGFNWAIGTLVVMAIGAIVLKKTQRLRSQTMLSMATLGVLVSFACAAAFALMA